MLPKKNLSINQGNKLSALLSLMERNEAKIKLEMDCADVLDQDCKPHKIRNKMSDQEYLQSGSLKVDWKVYPLCPRCIHTFINKFKENKATAKTNDKLTVEWNKKKKKLENYLYHTTLLS